MGVLSCYFRPMMFSPGDHARYHSRTLGAHVLATVVGPSPNGPQFCHIQYIHPGGVTPVDHESAQLSRLWRLSHPCNPPPPRDTVTWRPPPPPALGRPSRANPGVCKKGGGYIEDVNDHMIKIYEE